MYMYHCGIRILQHNNGAKDFGIHFLFAKYKKGLYCKACLKKRQNMNIKIRFSVRFKILQAPFLIYKKERCRGRSMRKYTL